MGARPLTELGRAMIASRPPLLANSPDYEAVTHAYAREAERIDATIEQVRRQFNPATADVALPAWEYTVRLPVPSAASIPQRQAAVVARLQKLLAGGSGLEWVAKVDALVGPGWSYEEHIPGDATSPPENTLRITLPFPPSGSRYQEALLQLAEVTPAHLVIEFASAAGFTWDESQWDLQEWGQ